MDWADPQEEPDEDTMAKVKVLYCRNLTVTVTEDSLRELFERSVTTMFNFISKRVSIRYGKVDRVKKIKDYAFVHFEERDQAVEAMKALNYQDYGGTKLEISLAKPPSDKKKKEEMLRKREQRMMQAMAERWVLMSLITKFSKCLVIPSCTVIIILSRLVHAGTGNVRIQMRKTTCKLVPDRP